MTFCRGLRTCPAAPVPIPQNAGLIFKFNYKLPVKSLNDSSELAVISDPKEVEDKLFQVFKGPSPLAEAFTITHSERTLS